MIFAAAAILILAAVAITLWVRAKDIPPPEPVSPTAHLEAKKQVIYENLRDLQFEYRMDKLSDKDYQESKLELQRELAGVLAEMEKIQKSGASAPPPPQPAPDKPRYVCPNCLTEFSQPMKFCGECGKAIPAAS